MRIGVIVAMDKEMAQLRGLLADAVTEQAGGIDFHVGHVGRHEVIAQKCGIGKVNAAVGALRLIDRYHPDALVSTGCAGGAQVSMQVGDVVVSTETVYHDAYCGGEVAFGQILGMPPRYQADPSLVDAAMQTAQQTGATLHAGLIVGGDWFVDSREKMGYILDRFPEAAAVDMESTAIAQTCHRCGVPFVSFRIVSDVPLSDHKASQYFDFWDRMAQGSFNVTKAFLENVG